MDQPTAQPAAPESLRILARRIVGPGPQEESLQLRVYCPERATTLPLEECAACPRCRGFSLDSTWRNSYLLCHSAAVSPEANEGSTARERRASRRTPLSALMSRDVVCVAPEVTLEALAALLLHRSISGAPVVDEQGRPVGLVSQTDLVRKLHEHTVVAPCRAVHVETERGACYDLGPGVSTDWLASTTVREIMMPVVFTVPEDTPVERAAALMALEGIHRVVVVAASGEVVGVLSAIDVVRWVAEQAGHAAR